jgi:hypothetical protein
MLRRSSWRWGFIIWLLGMLALAQYANAHDTGFAHSRRTMFVTADAHEVQLEYRVTANADEALIELALADADANGKISLAERDRYFTKLGEQLGSKLHCESPTGERLPLTLAGFHLDQALTQTFTFRIASSAAELTLTDKNFAHKPGQVRIVAGSGVSVELLENVDLMHTERVPLKIKRQSKT